MAKTVIFDLGGVLVQLDWDRVCGEFSALSGRENEFVRREVINGPIGRSTMIGQLGPCEFHRSLCDRLGVDLGYADFVDTWNSLLSANESIVPLVEQLQAGHQLVLASNTDLIHFTHAMENFGVLRLFDRHFLSYEMGLLNPDVAFFQHLLQALAIPAGDCVFIDDRADNIAAAASVGIVAVQYADSGHLQADLAAVL